MTLSSKPNYLSLVCLYLWTFVFVFVSQYLCICILVGVTGEQVWICRVSSKPNLWPVVVCTCSLLSCHQGVELGGVRGSRGSLGQRAKGSYMLGRSLKGSFLRSKVKKFGTEWIGRTRSCLFVLRPQLLSGWSNTLNSKHTKLGLQFCISLLLPLYLIIPLFVVSIFVSLALRLVWLLLLRVA